MGGARGGIYQQSQPIASFKNSERLAISRIAILYPRAQASKLQEELIIRIADSFYKKSIGYTTAGIDTELSQINLSTYLRRFQPTHILHVLLPMQRYYNGVVSGYTLHLQVVDTSDGVTVWKYHAEVRTGEDATVESVIASALSEVARDGLLDKLRKDRQDPGINPASRANAV